MPLPTQTPWSEMVKKFRALGWDGPQFGTKHPFMVKGTRKQRIPNSHTDPVHVSLLRRILAQAGIAREDWIEA